MNKVILPGHDDPRGHRNDRVRGGAHGSRSDFFLDVLLTDTGCVSRSSMLPIANIPDYDAGHPCRDFAEKYRASEGLLQFAKHALKAVILSRPTP
jgi:hypothetical protein